MKREYKEEIGKGFEEFVNTFGLEEVALDPDSPYLQEQCLKWI